MAAFAKSSVQAVFTTDRLEAIKQIAFEGATSLKYFDFKVGLLTIGQEAFYNCTNLSFASLPSSLKTVGASAFYNNSALTEV
jgi:hypothetical protein